MHLSITLSRQGNNMQLLWAPSCRLAQNPSHTGLSSTACPVVPAHHWQSQTRF